MKSQYPLKTGYTESTTSKEAALLVDQDSRYLEKMSAILLTLHHNPNSTPDEVADWTGLSQFYVRPRLTELRELGLVHRFKRSKRQKTGRAAWALMLPPNIALLLRETPEDEKEFVCRALWLEYSAIYEAQLLADAKATGLVTPQ